MLFHWLVDPSLRICVSVVAIGSLLVLNINMKAFFWTPHSQMFTILTPIATVALVRAVLDRPERGTRWYLGLGLALGCFTLAYGNWLYAALAVAAAVVLRLRTGGLLRAASVVTGTLLPTATWVATCIAVAGSYYNTEVVQFRQFVWMFDATRNGTLLSQIVTNLRSFARATLPTIALP
jgi:hypothetical protein